MLNIISKALSVRMQGHIINKACIILEVVIIAHYSSGCGAENESFLGHSHRLRFLSVPIVMHLKVTCSSPPPHPLLLFLDKLRCCSPCGDFISPLESWPTAEQVGGAGECPEITERD